MKFNFKVKSSAIQKIRYDSNSKILSIIFASSNKSYDYYNVPAREIINLVKANSVGKYFHSSIRPYYSIKEQK